MMEIFVVMRTSRCWGLQYFIGDTYLLFSSVKTERWDVFTPKRRAADRVATLLASRSTYEFVILLEPFSASEWWHLLDQDIR